MPSLFWPGRTAFYPALHVEGIGAPLAIPAGSVTVLPTASGVQSDVIHVVHAFSQNLSHRFVSGVTARRLGDGALLAEGVDYVIDYDAGRITGVRNVAGFDVDVSYIGEKARYDLVVADPMTAAVSVVTPLGGPDGRAGDPNEFAALCPPGRVPLFCALVTATRGIELIPVYQWRGLVKAGEEAEHTVWLDECRTALRRVWRKLRGGSLKLAAYGDSITAQGVGVAATTPDGADRDIMHYFLTGKVGPDAYTLIPLDQNGLHTRVGWVWALQAAMVESFRAVVTVTNWGVAGTTSGAGDNFGAPNGMNPNRLDPLVAAAPDLVVVGFGMNELGSADTYANLTAMLARFEAASIDAVIMGVPLPGRTGFSQATLEAWRYTNAEITRAARDHGVAHVPLARWCDPDDLGYLRVSHTFACAANGLNHPGLFELQAYGRLLAAIVPRSDHRSAE